ncbi:MAG: non-canonical purine NTP pyrophosphatase [Patescibacteria group bacterium]
MARKTILYATQNPAKLETLKNILGPEYTVLSLSDVGISDQAHEDGASPKENSIKKARACFVATGKPCFAMDFGLFIDGISDAEQPGPHIKKAVEKVIGHNPTDEEIIEYYSDVIYKLGGKTTAHWLRSFAFSSKDGDFCDEIKIPKILVSTPSKKKFKGFPMISLQFYPELSKYESEMSPEEKEDIMKTTHDAVREFINKFST